MAVGAHRFALSDLLHQDRQRASMCSRLADIKLLNACDVIQVHDVVGVLYPAVGAWTALSLDDRLSIEETPLAIPPIVIVQEKNLSGSTLPLTTWCILPGKCWYRRRDSNPQSSKALGSKPRVYSVPPLRHKWRPGKWRWSGATCRTLYSWRNLAESNCP